jgi:hypothetical protein
MMNRTRTLSLKMNDEEVLQAHALADASDESVGRFVRQLLAREYLRLFGQRPPPKVKTRMGRPRKAANTNTGRR